MKLLKKEDLNLDLFGEIKIENLKKEEYLKKDIQDIQDQEPKRERTKNRVNKNLNKKKPTKELNEEVSEKINLLNKGKIYEIFTPDKFTDELKVYLFKEFITKNKSIIYFQPENLHFHSYSIKSSLEDVIVIEYTSLDNLFSYLYELILNNFGDCIFVDHFNYFNYYKNENTLRFSLRAMKGLKGLLKTLSSEMSIYFLMESRTEEIKRSNSCPSLIDNYDHRLLWLNEEFKIIK